MYFIITFQQLGEMWNLNDATQDLDPGLNQREYDLHAKVNQIRLLCRKGDINRYVNNVLSNNESLFYLCQNCYILVNRV